MLYTSELFLDYFFHNPAIVLKYYDQISAEDLKILGSLQKEHVLQFAKSLKAKTYDNITTYYKPLFDIYGKQMRQLFSEFYLCRKIAPNESMKSYAAAFGEYLKLRLYNIKPRYLLDVVKFLTQKCQTKLIDLPPIMFKQEMLSRASKPCLAPNVTIESYQYNMVTLINEIQSNEVSANEGNFYYLMQSSSGKLRIFNLSPVVYYFLENCFGFYSLAELILKLVDKFDLLSQDIEELEQCLIPGFLNKNQLYLK